MKTQELLQLLVLLKDYFETNIVEKFVQTNITHGISDDIIVHATNKNEHS